MFEDSIWSGRVMLWKADLVRMLGRSRRTLERRLSAKEMPDPDVTDPRGHKGWYPSTIKKWIEEGMNGQGKKKK